MDFFFFKVSYIQVAGATAVQLIAKSLNLPMLIIDRSLIANCYERKLGHSP